MLLFHHIWFLLADPVHNTLLGHTRLTIRHKVEKDQFSDISTDPSKLSMRSTDHDGFSSDQVSSGYSASGSAREESTDSELDSRKDSFFSDEYLYSTESDEDNLKHMRELIDQKVRMSI